MMKTLEECVVEAMDGSDRELFPFLPYILQDLWEIGADPEVIIKLIQKHFEQFTHLKLLDLGCGKGAVSVRAARELGCICHGIDAIPEFIAFAKHKAEEFNVPGLCTFEIGDIREKAFNLSGYDIIVLGAIGPVFGDYYKTLTILSDCINRNGIFIIDDAYIDGDNNYSHSLMLRKENLLHQIELAGMELIENQIMEREAIQRSDNYIFEKLRNRCNELIKLYPEKQNLFREYIKKQVIENDVLENIAIGTTMVIKRKIDYRIT